MNLLEFQTASKRTMPFNGEPQCKLHFDHFFNNYAMGLVGEVIEAYQIILATPITDAQALKKELGDISHYAVGLAAVAHIQLPEHIELDVEDPDDIPVCETIENLVCEAGVIVEHAKKVFHHGHAFDARLLDILEVLVLVKKLAKAHGFKFSDVLATNIEKLKLRYPERFSSEDSKARVDEHVE